MGSPLPELTADAFRRRLVRALLDPAGLEETGRGAPPSLSERQVHLLWTHYRELRRWNPRLSLVGPGTAEEVVERHYAESLAALPLLSDAAPPPADPSAADRPVARLVDVGTGGGFPGLVLAVARPDLAVTLVEPRQRKVAFLHAALRSMSRQRGAPLSCEVLDARVQGSLPARLQGPSDWVTSRALAWSSEIQDPFLRESRRTRFLLWVGGEPPTLHTEIDELQPRIRRQVPLHGERRIVEILAAESSATVPGGVAEGRQPP